MSGASMPERGEPRGRLPADHPEIETGTDGTYTLHVVPGTYQLTFEPPGSDGFVLTARGPKSWGSNTTPRNVKIGGSTVRLNVKLPVLQ
jgi:hypothetical protein